MKRFVPLLLILALALVLVPSQTTHSQEISVLIDGKGYNFNPPPFIQDGRTLVPMRALFEALGADVDWEPDTRTAIGTRDNIEVRIPIDCRQPTINGKVTIIDVPAQIIQDRTFVPLRFVGEALGEDVDWDAANRTVIINRQQKGQPSDDSSHDTEDLLVHFIDVGQGDSILIEGPTGKVMLIDAGPRSAGEKVVSYLKQAGISSIDIFVGTHPHEDHIGGFIKVAENFPVGLVLDPGYAHTTQTYERFLTYIDENDIGYQTPRAGERLSFDPGLQVKVLHPHELMNDANNSSIVIKLDHGEVSFMFTGDAELEAEFHMLLQSRAQLAAEVLKVGHHGSRTSTSQPFLDAVSPEVAVIQVGEGNRYGHPHQDVLDRLAQAGVEIYRTDFHGDIVITSDGHSYNVSALPYEHEVSKPIAPPLETDVTITGTYVGSTESDRYHSPDCRHAQNILPENEVWFQTKDEAQSAGYVPCGVCNP